ncbi:hypothetical protein CVT24_002416 [Panaeolus cyanescens]|uniref:Uncharacterized protein n=1 Tax=Panaeolus cyanescens TaxID=181874 RepID=A0A409W0Z0_9AGAR|nr:hypothetical protein CVT24_002416 [Panaeolus cyanescens]
MPRPIYQTWRIQNFLKDVQLMPIAENVMTQCIENAAFPPYVLGLNVDDEYSLPDMNLAVLTPNPSNYLTEEDPVEFRILDPSFENQELTCTLFGAISVEDTYHGVRPMTEYDFIQDLNPYSHVYHLRKPVNANPYIAISYDIQMASLRVLVEGVAIKGRLPHPVDIDSQDVLDKYDFKIVGPPLTTPSGHALEFTNDAKKNNELVQQTVAGFGPSQGQQRATDSNICVFSGRLVVTLRPSEAPTVNFFAEKAIILGLTSSLNVYDHHATLGVRRIGDKWTLKINLLPHLPPAPYVPVEGNTWSLKWTVPTYEPFIQYRSLFCDAMLFTSADLIPPSVSARFFCHDLLAFPDKQNLINELFVNAKKQPFFLALNQYEEEIDYKFRLARTPIGSPPTAYNFHLMDDELSEIRIHVFGAVCAESIYSDEIPSMADRIFNNTGERAEDVYKFVYRLKKPVGCKSVMSVSYETQTRTLHGLVDLVRQSCGMSSVFNGNLDEIDVDYLDQVEVVGNVHPSVMSIYNFWNTCLAYSFLNKANANAGAGGLQDHQQCLDFTLYENYHVDPCSRDLVALFTGRLVVKVKDDKTVQFVALPTLSFVPPPSTLRFSKPMSTQHQHQRQYVTLSEDVVDEQTVTRPYRHISTAGGEAEDVDSLTDVGATEVHITQVNTEDGVQDEPGGETSTSSGLLDDIDMQELRESMARYHSYRSPQFINPSRWTPYNTPLTRVPVMMDSWRPEISINDMEAILVYIEYQARERRRPHRPKQLN